MVQWADTNPTMETARYRDWNPEWDSDWDDLDGSPPRRSKFVSIVAWSFIVIGTLVLLYAGLKLYVTFGDERLMNALQQARSGMNMLMMMVLSAAVLGLIGAACIVSGVGLRKRRNWGRMWASTLLALTLLFDIVWLFFFVTSVLPFIGSMPGSAQLYVLGNFALEAALLSLKIWVLYRLSTFEVRRECNEVPAWDV